MSKFYSLITMLLIVTIASSQTTYTWTNAAGGAWGTPGNWSPSRGVPAATDLLVFNIGSSYTVTGVPTESIASLTVSAGTVTFSGGGGTETLTVTNGNAGGADFVLSNGAAL